MWHGLKVFAAQSCDNNGGYTEELGQYFSFEHRNCPSVDV